MPLQAYTDPVGVHDPASGTVAPATWFTTHEANFRSLRSRPGAGIRSNGSQAFTSGSSVQANMGTVIWDIGSFTGTANQLTIPSGWAGKYLVSAQIRVDTGATGAHYCILEVQASGVSILRKTTHATSSGAVFDNTLSGAVVYVLAVADTLKLFVNPDSGTTSPDSEVGNIQVSLQAMWLAP